MPQPKRGEGRAVHFTYQVDLENPTKENLEKIKSTLVERITQSVQAELDAPAEDTTHDRHMSVHSKDKGLQISHGADVLRPIGGEILRPGR